MSELIGQSSTATSPIPAVACASAEALRAMALAWPLDRLMREACRLRDDGHGNAISYSRKVFIPLTRLCRDVCHYCTFATTPKPGMEPYLSVEEVVAIARAGQRTGCKEALFTLGDKPELRYGAARRWLDANGFASTIDYLAHAAGAVLDETGLLPHVNPGVLTAGDVARLRGVSISMGLMLESSAERLCEKGGPHYGSPDKLPAARLETIRYAGAARVPFTTGILIGIGETREERTDALLALRDLHAQYGHLQEIIIQNFRAKPDTRMARTPDAEHDDLKWTIAMARLAFGAHMNIQAPPNLSYERFGELIEAGLNDWGGISPVTPDHVNPEAAWPDVATLAAACEARGKVLVERLASYPAYVSAQAVGTWHDRRFVAPILRATDASGFVREDAWAPGQQFASPLAGEVARRAGRGDAQRNRRTVTSPLPGPPSQVGREGRQSDDSNAAEASSRVSSLLDRAAAGHRLDAPDIVRLFEARGHDLQHVITAADELRRAVNGDTVTYVVNRNINYTNICGYKCRFCAFSKGTAKALRGRPYDLDLDEIVRRSQEAWARGGTEVCLQGGIHPDYTGATYLAICRAIKAALPKMHVHAFSPLEVAQGAATLGVPVKVFLEQLAEAGLGTLPGTAAEILDDEVRRDLCPDKLSSGEWLEVVAAAHEVGFKTTATIMFGHIDRPIHWARHLLAIRDLQERTGGFTELVPLPFIHMEAPMSLKGGARMGPTAREAILIHAVARLVLHPLIPNIQASWVKLGPEGVKAALEAGVNDLGGTLMNESISRAAGTTHGEELAPEGMDALIRSCGRAPRQRTTLYGEPLARQVASSYGAQPCTPRNEPLPRRGLPSRMAGVVLSQASTVEAAE
jgi:FO synthase